MIAPLRVAPALDPGAHAAVLRRAIFDCCKWDPQVEDCAVLARYPLLLGRAEWDVLARGAEALAAETLAAEEALAARPELMRRLAIPWGMRRLLRRGPSPGAARVMRFDFHATTEGWRISEANTDVPGGFVEASGFSRLVLAHYPGRALSGDPAAALASAVLRAAGPGAAVGMVHATAYTDDRQVMVFLARRLAEAGLAPSLLSPADLEWKDGRAHVRGGARLELLVRFFPAEWLPNLGRRAGWHHFFTGAATPQANPASALLTQSKRFPLAWSRLGVDLPAWRALLPETRAPEEVDWRSGEWALKPAFGRVGDGIGLMGVTPPDAWRKLAREVARHPGGWAAQRRFQVVPVATPDGPQYPCVGVYVIDGRAAGAYGRMSGSPVIDHRARDVAVLVEGA